MVTFNDLRISEDGSCLIVDVEITDLDIYSNMYIDSIYLDYYGTFSSSLPSASAYTMYDNRDADQTVKHKRIVLPKAFLGMTNFGISSFDKGMFFVTVRCDGVLPSSIVNYACGYDDTVNVGVILDWKYFYQKGIQYAAGMVDPCHNKCIDNTGFEDFILQWNALKLAVNTCDWMLAAKLWNKLVNHCPGVAKVSAGCGCGR